MGVSSTKVSTANSSDSTSIVPIKPSNPLISLVDEIRELVADDSNDHPITHAELLSKIHALELAAETPLETIYRIGHQSWQNAAVRVALELDVFRVLVEQVPKPVSAEELASKHAADAVLVCMSNHDDSLL